MNICASGHDEVVYDGRDCPACNLLNQIADLEKELKDETTRADAAEEKWDNHECPEVPDAGR